MSNTEAVGGPHCGFGPARIGILRLRKLQIERKSDSTLHIRSVGVLHCIVELLLTDISRTNMDKMKISIPMQIFIEGSTNDEF